MAVIKFRGDNRFDPRRLPRQRRAVETVERILEAAAALLPERGFEGANTNVIAERAAVRPPAVYRYFPNKFALYYHLADKLQAELDIALDAALVDADSRPLNDLVDRLVEVTGEFWLRRPAFGLLWFGEWASKGDPMPRLAFGARMVARLSVATTRFRHLGAEREGLVLATAMHMGIAIVHMGQEMPDLRPAVLAQAKLAIGAYLASVLTYASKN